MDYLYKLNKIQNGYELLGKNGNQLISFLNEPDFFHVSYSNKNIDKENLLINAESQYGAVYDWCVKCGSKKDYLQCCSRFIKLVSNGFVSDSQKLIAMDWGDLERICKGTNYSYYYYAEGSLNSINNFIDYLSQKLEKWSANLQLIICVEGNIGLNVFWRIASSIMDISQNVCQLLYDKNAEILRIDVWVNSKEKIF